MRKFIKKLKNSIAWKLLKILFTLVKWVVEIVIIGIAIIIITQRVTNSQKAFLGIRIFDVATGSMEPEYAVGDVLIVREKDPSTIVVGDNIVYIGNVADYKGKIITHNVIEIEQNEEGEYLFHTKGIANTVEDPIVHEDQLYGIVVQNNRVLAFVCKILLNKYGLYFLVIIPLILYAFIEFVRAQGEKMEQEREEERERKRLEQEKQLKKENKKSKNIEEQDEEVEEHIEEEVIAPKKRNSKTNTKKKIEVKEKEETEPKQENKKTTRKKASENKEKVENVESKTTRKKKNASSEEKDTVKKTANKNKTAIIENVEETKPKTTRKKKSVNAEDVKDVVKKKSTKKKSESSEKEEGATTKSTRKKKAKEE